MTRETAKTMLEAKLTCLSREVSGTACAGIDCNECEWNYAQGNMGEQIEALTLAIAALEKQIPQESVATQWQTNAGALKVCPVCNSALAKLGSFCRVCGQAIKMEDK